MRNTLLVFALFNVSVFGQGKTPDQDVNPDPESSRNSVATHRWLAFPLPIGTSSLPPLRPGQLIDPLTPKSKLVSAINRTVGPEALTSRAFLAGLDQWRTRPEEWGQGWDAYGQRYGHRMARLAARNSIVLGVDLLMHTDQRYDRCACTGFWPRTGQVVRRVFVARHDSGGERPNLARIAGAYGGAAIGDQLYPDRYHTVRHTFTAGSKDLLWRVVNNMVREFWPEIHRAIRIGPPASSRSPE